MSILKSYLHWFVIGMGNVMGMSHSIPPLRAEASEAEAIGGDFRAIGDDFRFVMAQTPANAESVKSVDSTARAQLELAGLS